MSANSRHPSRGEDSITSLRNGAMNASRKNGASARRREEADDIGSDPRWTLLYYC